MISYIRGELAAQYEDKVIVDVGGVGYGIYMSAQSMSKLPPIGSEVKIHTYLNVKEDSMQLFGFLTVDDLNVFKLLIGVSGIGPKGGQAILSVLSPDDLRFAVMADDVKAISSAPGIGKKTAQKLIVELKDKLSIEDALEHAITEDGALKAQMSTGGDVYKRQATYSTMVDGCTWKCIWYLDCKTAFWRSGTELYEPGTWSKMFPFDFFYKSDDDIRL